VGFPRCCFESLIWRRFRGSPALCHRTAHHFAWLCCSNLLEMCKCPPHETPVTGSLPHDPVLCVLLVTASLGSAVRAPFAWKRRREAEFEPPFEGNGHFRRVLSTLRDRASQGASAPALCVWWLRGGPAGDAGFRIGSDHLLGRRGEWRAP
jgi:hypothetical protein